MREELRTKSKEDINTKSRVFVNALDHSLDRLPNINDLASILADRVTTTLEFTRSKNHGTLGYKTRTSLG